MAPPPTTPYVRKLYADDQLWVVREFPVPYHDRRGGTHLIFESDQAMNRVRVFPANWHELPDAELFALTWHVPRKPEG